MLPCRLSNRETRFRAVDALQELEMNSTIRWGVWWMGLTLLVSHDSAVGSLGLACVGPLKGVFFFRILSKIYNYTVRYYTTHDYVLVYVSCTPAACIYLTITECCLLCCWWSSCAWWHNVFRGLLDLISVFCFLLSNTIYFCCMPLACIVACTGSICL